MRLPCQPSLELMMEGSLELLQEWELNRWNLVSRLRRQRNALQDEIDRLTSEALEARFLIENRQELLEYGRTKALQKTLAFIESPGIHATTLKAEPKRAVVDTDELREVG